MEKHVEKKQKDVAAEAPSSAFRSLMPWHWGERRRGIGSADPFETLQETMNRLFEGFRRDIGVFPGNGDLGAVSSRMDIAETDDTFEVTLELPGMDEKNIELSITRDALTVHGEKKSETSEKKKNYHYRECSYGSVDRVVSLPDGVDTDKASATFKKGVLKVTLPKTAEAQKQSRKIAIAS